MADEQEEEDREESFYASIRTEELLAYGFSRKCLAEVHDMLGHLGIEVLHDAI
jgi:hypothetical protein